MQVGSRNSILTVLEVMTTLEVMTALVMMALYATMMIPVIDAKGKVDGMEANFVMLMYLLTLFLLRKGRLIARFPELEAVPRWYTQPDESSAANVGARNSGLCS